MISVADPWPSHLPKAPPMCIWGLRGHLNVNHNTREFAASLSCTVAQTLIQAPLGLPYLFPWVRSPGVWCDRADLLLPFLCLQSHFTGLPSTFCFQKLFALSYPTGLLSCSSKFILLLKIFPILWFWRKRRETLILFPGLSLKVQNRDSLSSLIQKQ